MGEVRVGTSGWSYPTWVGSFYPAGTSSAGMLRYYAEQFGAVEAHSTHRRLPSAAALVRWAADVPATFRFAPKAHAGITHRRDLDGVGDRIRAFIDALQPLGERLGPILFVLPHRQPDLDRLDRLLDALSDRRGAMPVFELGPAWWVDEVRHRLSAAGASLAWVDRDGEPPGVPPRGPADVVSYVRLRRSQYTDEDLEGWAKRLRQLAGGRSARDAYAFVKHDEQGHGPRYARALVQHLKRA